MCPPFLLFERSAVRINKETSIAILSLSCIVLYLLGRFVVGWPILVNEAFLWVALFFGGIPLVFVLLCNVLKGRFGSDLLAGISIVTSVVLEQYLAGSLVVLMLSGGEALEKFALRKASGVLEALSRRMPNKAHKRHSGQINDVSTDDISVGDECVIFPHEICPVDGIVIEGQGNMDESYLTGEPFLISKTQGAGVISGAINGQGALTIRATKLAQDSRYSKIMEVMDASQQSRPQLRRLADHLGAWYTPLACAIALVSWIISGDPNRFLAVLVIATPCPLLIAIPVAIISAISLCAQKGIIIKDPAVLEQIDRCRTMILDKTGTLTYGRPQLSYIHCFYPFTRSQVLCFAASLERYSKHPLAGAILDKAKQENLDLVDASRINESSGMGLTGTINNHQACITGRKAWLNTHEGDSQIIPPPSSGLECLVSIDGSLAALFQFQDEPRLEGRSFINHLGSEHHFEKVIIVSGDHEKEVRFLADYMGIEEVYANQSPEQKVEIVRKETQESKTVYLGDGINDAPALLTATVGIAFGQNSDITSEAAGAVIMESSLEKVDEFFHIGKNMRFIALQSAVGGMFLSLLGMYLAAVGLLAPVAGAIAQEVVDLIAVVNALRVAFIGKELTDF